MAETAERKPRSKAEILLRLCDMTLLPIAERYAHWGRHWGEVEADRHFDNTLWSLLKRTQFEESLDWLKIHYPGAADILAKAIERPKRIYTQLAFRCLGLLQHDTISKSQVWEPYAIVNAIEEATLEVGVRLGERERQTVRDEIIPKYEDLPYHFSQGAKRVSRIIAFLKTEAGWQGAAPKPRFVVDCNHAKPSITIDGICYPLGNLEVAEFLRDLVAEPTKDLSATSYKVRTRQLNKLPQPVQDRIERKSNAGCRWIS